MMMMMVILCINNNETHRQKMYNALKVFDMSSQGHKLKAGTGSELYLLLD